MNLNKLFPRLSITAKLAIAFITSAVAPLIVVGVVGGRSALRELRSSIIERLAHDMDLAQARVERGLRELTQHLSFVVEAAARPVLDPGEEDPEAVRRLLRTYLLQDPSALMRIKVLDAEGAPRLVVNVDDRLTSAEEGLPSDLLYQLTAERLGPGGRAVFPVELRARGGARAVLPAVAAVVPVYDGGRYLGAVVGEASAERLFEPLALASPGLEAVVTALADAKGRYLYHSEYKDDWSRLLSAESAGSLLRDFPPEVMTLLREEGAGLLGLDDGREVVLRRIDLEGSRSQAFYLVRAFPRDVLLAKLRGFLVAFGALGGIIVAMVSASSVVAARQVSRPIYALRDAAKAIAAGSNPPPVVVETNDEIEDLAGDFNEMARALARHRAHLEALVEERTTELRRTEARLGQIVTDAADAILGLDAEGRITLWNRGAEELFGYSEDEALGRHAGELLGPSSAEDPSEARFIQRMIDEGGTVVNHRTRRRHKDGHWIPVTITKSVLREADGRVLGHSLIIRDDSQRERLEEQMRRSERLAAISVMAGGIAHELNNPLSVLSNRIELMQRELKARDGDQRLLADLEVLHKHVGRISSITTDLLRYAREDTEDICTVDVNEVVGRMVRLLRKVFVSSGLTLRTELDPELPHVLATPTVLETVVVNLLLNAQQATPEGGEVVVATRRANGGRDVEIEVRDTGPGVPEELRLRIFEPFFTTKAERGGTGLGLAVVRAMMERLGGEVRLESCEGGGACFVLTLPRDAREIP
ncbi:MAG: ATP-binding protein [Gemmatimonadota bacterium]